MTRAPLNCKRNGQLRNKKLIAKSCFYVFRRISFKKEEHLDFPVSFKIKEHLDFPFSLKIEEHLDYPFSLKIKEHLDYPLSCKRLREISRQEILASTAQDWERRSNRQDIAALQRWIIGRVNRSGQSAKPQENKRLSKHSSPRLGAETLLPNGKRWNREKVCESRDSAVKTFLPQLHRIGKQEVAAKTSLERKMEAKTLLPCPTCRDISGPAAFNAYDWG